MPPKEMPRLARSWEISHWENRVTITFPRLYPAAQLKSSLPRVSTLCWNYALRMECFADHALRSERFASSAATSERRWLQRSLASTQSHSCSLWRAQVPLAPAAFVPATLVLPPFAFPPFALPPFAFRPAPPPEGVLVLAPPLLPLPLEAAEPLPTLLEPVPALVAALVPAFALLLPALVLLAPAPLAASLAVPALFEFAPPASLHCPTRQAVRSWP